MKQKKNNSFDDEQLIVILSAIQKSPQHPLHKIIKEKEKQLIQSPAPTTTLLEWLKQTLDEHPEYLQ